MKLLNGLGMVLIYCLIVVLLELLCIEHSLYSLWILWRRLVYYDVSVCLRYRPMFPIV